MAALGDLGRRASRITHGELTLDVARDKIVEVLNYLRDDARCLFEVLIDICGVDWPARPNRFDVVYHLLSPRLNQRIRIKLQTDETTPVPSTVGVFSGLQLVRARSLRHVRHPVLRPPRPAPPAHRLRLPGLSAAQGFPAHRLRRGALRRRAEARRLRARRADAGVPLVRFRIAVGGHALRAAGRREGAASRRPARHEHDAP